MTRRRPSQKDKPWVLIIEFPHHKDARAAYELLSSQFPEHMSVRQKHFHPSDGNIATWRSTAVLRAALGTRTFGREDVLNALLAAGYNNSGRSWITHAYRFSVIERLSKGTYRFLPLPAELPAPPVGGYVATRQLEFLAGQIGEATFIRSLLIYGYDLPEAQQALRETLATRRPR